MSDLKVVKNASGKVVAYGPNVEQYAPTVGPGHSQQTLTEAELSAAIAKTNTQLKTEELGALSTAYIAAVRESVYGWSAAEALDGAAESAKKGLVQEDLAELKAQYALDRAAVAAKYA